MSYNHTEYWGKYLIITVLESELANIYWSEKY